MLFGFSSLLLLLLFIEVFFFWLHCHRGSDEAKSSLFKKHIVIHVMEVHICGTAFFVSLLLLKVANLTAVIVFRMFNPKKCMFRNTFLYLPLLLFCISV